MTTATLYPNPYMTITPNEYTKHFFMNGERLTSSIGGGGWCSVSPDAISSSLTSHEMDLIQVWNNMYNNEYPFEYPHETMPSLTTNEDIFGQTSPDLQYVCPMRHLYTLNMDNKQDILWSVMHDFCPSSDDKTIYYRHSDHLGSANWITDQDGHAVQYLHYLPYGELLLNQQVAGYDERYKFTDKERDAESGYDYFGARYYASPLYNWTSVDPLSDKFPQISPYAYCNWNPIKFIDPDGDSLDFSKVIEFDMKNRANVIDNTINDLQTITGLSLSMDNGLLDYSKDEYGNPIILKSGGSETARNQLITLIDALQMIEVHIGNKSFGKENNIVLAPIQINEFINGSYNVDGRTLGYGMTFLHESYHTNVGGGLLDAPYTPGPTVEKMNIIRQEMNRAGYNFGQRMSYYAIPSHGRAYLCFNKAAQNAMNAGLLPSTLFGQQYIHFPNPQKEY